MKLKLEQVLLAKEQEEQGSGETPVDAEDACLICMENKKCVVFFPCNHLCVCEECDALMNRKQGALCILCRAEISERERLFSA